MVAAGAVTEHLAVDAGAAGDGMVPVFEHQRRPALTEDQTATVDTERAAGLRRSILVAARQNAQGLPRPGHRVGLRRIGTTGQHHRRLAATHAAKCLADGDGG